MLRRLPFALAWGLGALLVASPAMAQPRVLWLDGDPQAEARAAALAVELAPRRAAVIPGGPPPGDSPSVRATTARGAARAQGADGALWLEREPDGGLSMRAVAPDRQLMAWAPVSAPAAPRVLALIGASLLDELLAEPAPEAVSVTVRVRAARDLDPPTPSAAPARAVPPPPPRLVLTSPALEPSGRGLPQRRDFYLEGAVLFAGVSAGLGAAVGFYPHRSIRWDFRLRGTYVFPAASFGGALTTSVAYVTDDDDGRFEVGLEPGLLFVSENATGVGLLGGTYAGFSWRFGDATRLGFRLSAALAYLKPGDDVTPAAFVELYTQVMP